MHSYVPLLHDIPTLPTYITLLHYITTYITTLHYIPTLHFNTLQSYITFLHYIPTFHSTFHYCIAFLHSIITLHYYITLPHYIPKLLHDIPTLHYYIIHITLTILMIFECVEKSRHPTIVPLLKLTPIKIGWFQIVFSFASLSFLNALEFGFYFESRSSLDPLLRILPMQQRHLTLIRSHARSNFKGCFDSWGEHKRNTLVVS